MTVNIPVLLVGSLPLAGPREVFTAAADLLRDHLTRMPDGETGSRSTWIHWQHDVFARLPELEPTAVKEREYQAFAPYRLRSGARGDTIAFGALGFRDEAEKSYAIFSALKHAGRIPAHMRFQLCLPTPFAPTYAFVAYESQEAVYPAYEAALLRELAAIAALIPAHELAVQWDVATEMSIWEELYPATFPDPKNEIVARLAHLGRAVPQGAELAYHLCYGSMNNRHWKEPEDTRKLVEVANRLCAAVPRAIDWMHLPVPIARDDARYFAPLADLDRRRCGELFLGLLHLDDGIEGARRRANAARAFTPRFGISAECGLGRRPPDSAGAWLALHRDAALALGSE
jgi:hypothetical protein